MQLQQQTLMYCLNNTCMTLMQVQAHMPGQVVSWAAALNVKPQVRLAKKHSLAQAQRIHLQAGP